MNKHLFLDQKNSFLINLNWSYNCLSWLHTLNNLVMNILITTTICRLLNYTLILACAQKIVYIWHVHRTWGCYKQHIYKMSVAEMRMFRLISENTHKNRIQNEEIYLKVGVAPINKKMREICLRWFEMREVIIVLAGFIP